MSKKVGYARVSTKAQNLTMQRRALKAAGCQHIFYDRGVSGKVFPRKGLTDALNTLNRGDTLIAYKQDRLGRLVLELAKLLHHFLDNGIQFISLTQSMDITVPNGRLMYHICAVLAEHESDQTGERTKDGLDIKKAQGKRLGRKPKLSQNDALAALKMLGAEDMTVASTAKWYGVSSRTLRRSIDRLESEGQ